MESKPLETNIELRDVLAASALTGILSQPNGNPCGNPYDIGLCWAAATAYALADAMLAQRNTDNSLTTAVRQMRQRHKHKAELSNLDDCGCEDCRSLEAAMGA